MIGLPGGDLLMGDHAAFGATEEVPVHAVHVKPFQIGKYEVTFDEWDACARSGPCSADIFDQRWGRGRRPVVNVRWDEAQTYVRWLSAQTGKHYRLPTEAEWEYAARAGTRTVYPWGDHMLPGMAVCYSECGEEADKSAVVGSAAPNAFGLHDLHGNVWEWVEDCWNDTYKGAPADGSAWTAGDCERRVVRGGAWLSLSFDVRSSIRTAHPSSIRYSNLGFRVARTE